MVFFQCDGCGEALKKAKVESHRYQCRNSSVSCIDCNKVFDGNSYAQHNTCVSEAERYQGQLYKGVSNKQARKQEQQQNWLDGVREALSSAAGVDAKLRPVLQRMVAYDNIPKKRNKFENFCRNSLAVRDESVIARIYEQFLAPANAAPAPAPATPTPAADSEGGEKRKADDEVKAEAEAPKKQKVEKEAKSKKSKKDKKEDAAEVKEPADDSKDAKVKGDGKKSKKGEKKTAAGTDEAAAGSGDSKKDKKSKKEKKAKSDPEGNAKDDVFAAAIKKALKKAGAALEAEALRKKVVKQCMAENEGMSKKDAKKAFDKALGGFQIKDGKISLSATAA